MDVFAAIQAGDLDGLRAIVAADPSAAAARNADGLSAVLAAQYRHQPEAVLAILDAQPPLDVFDAAAVGATDRLADLLAADPALVNAYAADGHYPLGLAAFFGQPDAVRLLLEHGADTGQVARNDMAVQALHAAVAGRNVEAVRLLLEAGADPNATQHGGWTPLAQAEHHGDAELIELLVRHGAQPTEPAEPSDPAGTSGNRPTTS